MIIYFNFFKHVVIDNPTVDQHQKRHDYQRDT